MKNKTGFSLVEMLCVLVLFGIISSAVTIGFSKSISQFNFTRENDAMSQKAQVALNRILMEFTYLDPGAAASTLDFSGNSYKYPTSCFGTSEINSFVYDPSAKQLLWNHNQDKNSYVLCDNVSGFSMSLTPAGATPSTLKQVTVTISLTGSNNVTQQFVTQVAIKNLGS